MIGRSKMSNKLKVQQIDIEQKQQNEMKQPVHFRKKQEKEQIKQQQSNKGVCYISRIPPYMKPNYIRKLLQQYGVQRIYLLQESQWLRKSRAKHGGNKRICFTEGWAQFQDKRMAKLAALKLNSQKMVTNKKNSFYSQDVWNLKYLPKFKWHHLTQKLAHDQRIKKEQLKMQLEQERKIQDFYEGNIFKSKKIQKIIANKKNKGKALKNPSSKRNFQQKQLIQEQKDQ